MNKITPTKFQLKVWKYLRKIPKGEVKTYKQVEYKKTTIDITKKILKKNGIFYLYRGYFPPLIGGCLQNCFMFSSEHMINKLVNNNSVLSGFLAGCLTSIIISPAELIKCKLQINKKETIQNILTSIKKSL